mmetsp:Transcript_92698/g.215427  ORF Transcript_92698/g.215427 Transcript_92698/m.215427 type:complete len:599 (-) Transcript_92698:282-2078(-)|eukprot:CAMPEP_0171109008 /NCGR_PEP_ID=MMETSP0766_2-20121228/70080_1 /TAXON_ID=439317 /ORGANISM="Gambierdiscus australes, Strain CAWD 149" /LENGTH=598 /DNA_ID=CAMNT_0011570653 /DNA_START=86 /DNA_END=1882 /DNA_ORIENTATION=+
MGMCGSAPVPKPVAPRAKKPHVTATTPITNMVVQVDRAIARRGSIPISGRYTCSRKLEQDYAIESKVLGSGMSGPVLLAISKKDGRKYAVKSFKKKVLSSKHRGELQNEVEVYLTLDHPHIAKLEMVFETDEALHLVMEYMEGGELYDRLAARRQYTEEDAGETAYQILLAVAYLHAHQIAHRDLKLENFLYEKKDNDLLKLIDFGFAKFWDPSTTMSQSCGSLHYVAPEVLAHSYTTQADMWSVGVLVYMLLVGVPLFHGSDDEILKNIKACKPRFSSRFARLSEQAQTFVRALLVKDTGKRLTASLALEHPWIKGRKQARAAHIDTDILASLRSFAHASHFRRAVLSMMAWSLSTDDIAELREQFLLLDNQKQGTITHQELKLVLEERFHIGSDEARQLFESLDTDNNEQIEYTEFLAAALMGRVKAHEDVLRKTFARFDRDGSGLVSTTHLHSVLGDSFERDELEAMIREVDTSGDGKIDYDEFIAYVLKPEDMSAEKCERARKRHQTTHTLGKVIDQLMEESPKDEPALVSARSRMWSSSKRQQPMMPATLLHRLSLRPTKTQTPAQAAAQAQLPALLFSNPTCPSSPKKAHKQ